MCGKPSRQPRHPPTDTIADTTLASEGTRRAARGPGIHPEGGGGGWVGMVVGTMVILSDTCTHQRDVVTHAPTNARMLVCLFTRKLICAWLNATDQPLSINQSLAVAQVQRLQRMSHSTRHWLVRQPMKLQR